MIKTKIVRLSLAILAVVVATSVAFGPRSAYANTASGGSWTTVATQEPSDYVAGELYDMSCASATSCHAIGVYTDVNGDGHLLIEGYDGTSWKVESHADPAGYGGYYLSDITCLSTTFCVAVGQ